MNREFLKNLGIADDLIDKIMAEHGRTVQAEKDKAAKVQTDLSEANKTIETYKTQIAELEKKSGDNEDVKKQLKELQDKIAEDKRLADERAADEQLTNTIRAALPKDKKFVNEYTEQAYLGQIKTELAKPENKGKGISEIFETLTKDKAGIFANPNEITDQPGFHPDRTEHVDDARMRSIFGLPEKKE